MDGSRRRIADCGSHDRARQGRRDSYRYAGRSDEGIHRSRAYRGQKPCQASGHQGRRFREKRHAHSRAGRGNAERWTVSWYHNDDGAGVQPDRDSVRADVAMTGEITLRGESLTDWRPEGKTAGRATWGHQARLDSGRKYQGLGGQFRITSRTSWKSFGALGRQGAGIRFGASARAVAGYAARSSGCSVRCHARQRRAGTLKPSPSQKAPLARRFFYAAL